MNNLGIDSMCSGGFFDAFSAQECAEFLCSVHGHLMSSEEKKEGGAKFGFNVNRIYSAIVYRQSIK